MNCSNNDSIASSFATYYVLTRRGSSVTALVGYLIAAMIVGPILIMLAIFRRVDRYLENRRA